MVIFQIGTLAPAALQTSVYLSSGYFLLSAASYILYLGSFGIDLVRLYQHLAQ